MLTFNQLDHKPDADNDAAYSLSPLPNVKDSTQSTAMLPHHHLQHSGATWYHLYPWHAGSIGQRQRSGASKEVACWIGEEPVPALTRRERLCGGVVLQPAA